MITINNERVAEAILVRELEGPFRAKHNKPSLSARVFQMGAREAEEVRKLQARIRRNGEQP